MKELEDLRRKIDKIDVEILALISKRLSIARGIAEVKKKNNLPIYDPEREKKLLQKIAQLSKEKSLDENTIEKIYKLLIEYTRNSERC